MEDQEGKEKNNQERWKGEIKKIWNRKKRHRSEGKKKKKDGWIEQQNHPSKGGRSAGTVTEGW